MRLPEKERARLIQLLRESSALYYSYFQHSGDGVAVFEAPICSNNLRLLECNESYCRMAGRTREELLVHGDIREWQDGDVLSWPLASMEKNTAGSSHYHDGSFSWRRPDGRENVVEYRAVPVELEDRMFLYTINRDITAKRKMENMLRLQRNLSLSLSETSDLQDVLSLILNSILQIEGIDCGGIYLREDVSDDFTLVSHQGLPEEFAEQSLSGVTANSSVIERIMAGKPYYGSRPDDFPEMVVKVVQESAPFHALGFIPVTMKGRVTACIMPASRLHHLITVEAQSILESIAASVGGVIARVRAQEALERSEAKFAGIFKESPDSIIITRLKDGLILDFNEGFRRLMGYEPEECIGKTVLELGMWVDRSMRDVYHHELRSNERSGEMEIEFRTKEGRIIPCQVTGRLFKMDGQPCVISISRDMSAQKEAERQLLTYQRQLRNLAAELTVAESRERRHIAQDLHDQIGQILFLTRMKADQCRISATDLKTRRLTEELIELVNRALRDVRSLIVEISPPVLQVMGLEHALRDLAESIETDHGLRVDYSESGPTMPLPQDFQDLLYRCVREILLNTVKHARATTVSMDVSKEDGFVGICIQDDGTGFDVSSMDTVAENAVGFGLFSIRERISAIGGRFKVTSKPGQGTRVTMVLHSRIDAVKEG
jgi:PAS domain S-box-containing protein